MVLFVFRDPDRAAPVGLGSGIALADMMWAWARRGRPGIPRDSPWASPLSVSIYCHDGAFYMYKKHAKTFNIFAKAKS